MRIYVFIERYIMSLRELYKIKYHQNKMMRARGFIDRLTLEYQKAGQATHSETDYANLDYDTFKRLYPAYATSTFNWILGNLARLDVNHWMPTIREKFSNIYTNTLTDETIFVYYVKDTDNKTVPKDETKKFHNLIGNLNSYNGIGIRRAIMVSTNMLNKYSIEYILQDMVAFDIQHFIDLEFKHDPTEHFLVPKHVALTPDETRQFYAQGNINPDGLPKILTIDRIVKYYGFVQGQIIRIHRQSPYEKTMVSTYYSYRIVYKPNPLEQPLYKTVEKDKKQRKDEFKKTSTELDEEWGNL